MFYTYSIPRFFQKLFKNYVWSIPENDKVLYLTFDDGPTPGITENILTILKEHQVKATFFCLGKNIGKYPDIVRAIVKDNHQIANHSYTHQNAWKTPTQTLIKEVLHTQDLLTMYKKDAPKLFRPPYGKILPKQAEALRKQGYKIIMWEVLSGDFDRRISPKKILNNTTKKVKSGSIVVFHDSKKAYKNLEYVLPQALQYWMNAGYQFSIL